MRSPGKDPGGGRSKEICHVRQNYKSNDDSMAECSYSINMLKIKYSSILLSSGPIWIRLPSSEPESCNSFTNLFENSYFNLSRLDRLAITFSTSSRYSLFCCLSPLPIFVELTEVYFWWFISTGLLNQILIQGFPQDLGLSSLLL